MPVCFRIWSFSSAVVVRLHSQMRVLLRLTMRQKLSLSAKFSGVLTSVKKLIDNTLQTKHQFIELYNTNIQDLTAAADATDAGAIDLTGWTLTFTDDRPAPANDVDQVSNVPRSLSGWVVDVGQSGRKKGTTGADAVGVPIDIVSMYRKINYAKVQNTDGGDAAKRTDGVPDGNAKGSWAASTRATTEVGVFSSRGKEHFVGLALLTQTAVPRSPFVINELGNQTGGTNDWVELRNASDAVASLKNYQLSVVTGDTATKKDTQLFKFEGNDYKVPAGGVIVVTSTHPRNTDLAAGKDVSLADDDEDNRGASHLFVVKSFDLPDSGKNLLILRNNHDAGKLGTPNNIIDVIGTLGITVNDAGFSTSLWPLAVTAAPHDKNVIEPGDEELKAGFVYTRANAGGGTGEKHIGVAGYTGIGYDRAAVNSPANGGTPGYDNGALKGKVAELSDAVVTISEIMVDVGEGRQSLPQWIEIYNSSMTQAVNTAGWKLAIENANDVETSFSATLTLGAKTISPNQTILIATNSGSVADPDHFPSTRVINLWTTKDHRDELEMVRRTDQVFSTTGFHFKLTDADNKLVDEAGNLDGNRRTQDDPAWPVPAGEEDGRRSSLIRVYDAGVAITGTLAAAWVSADANEPRVRYFANLFRCCG